MKAYERLLNYVTYDTQSDENSSTCPSTLKQLELSKLLVKELEALGVQQVELDEYGYTYATVPATPGSEKKPAVAFIAHVDTSDESSGKDVKARLIENYDGSDILLENGIVTDVKSFPYLTDCIGDTLIVTDGTTLLGADDKAGVADIMTAVESWIKDNKAPVHDPKLAHPELRIVFTPDEEIGAGTEKINMEKVNAACGYTVDGTEIGVLSYECFQAAAGTVKIRGNAVHPGSAFGIQRNASLLAMEFQAMLPVFENPASTLGRMGFFHLTGMEGCVETAELRYILRDHDRAVLEHRKEIFRKIAELLNLKYGEGTAEVTITDTYPNMVEYILPEHPEVIEAARAAIKEAGLKPDESPVRGGTDGAHLSALGLPCPNLSYGGYYCHGVHEFASVQKMDKAVEIILNTAKNLA